jgi:CRP-like cAMP-binding protein
MRKAPPDPIGEMAQAAEPVGTAVERLRRLPFLAPAPEAALQRLGADARWRVLAPGEMVVDTGDDGQDVFFVCEGAVRVVLRSAAGDELILNELGPGEFFGELAAIDGVQRSAGVTALYRSCICRIPGPSFLALVLQNPAMAHALLRLLAARLRAKDERRLESATLSVGEQVMAELLRLSRRTSDGRCRISPPPPQHVLAARLGLRRETISRELSKLARAGRVTVGRSAIILHHPDHLLAEIRYALRGPA